MRRALATGLALASLALSAGCTTAEDAVGDDASPLVADFAAVCLATHAAGAQAAAEAARGRGFETREAPRAEIGGLIAETSRRFLGANEVEDGSRVSLIGETPGRFATGRRLRVEAGEVIEPTDGFVPARGCLVEARAEAAPSAEAVRDAAAAALAERLGPVEGPETETGTVDGATVWRWQAGGRAPRIVEVAYRRGGGFVSVASTLFSLTRGEG